MNDNPQRIVALDIGTGKVAVIVADIDVTGKVNIIAANTCPCEGLKKGLVVDIDETTHAIHRVIEETEKSLKDDMSIKEVHVGVTGDHIEGCNVEGRAVVKDGEIKEHDIDRAREAAEAMVPVTGDRMILHTLYRNFEVSGQSGIKEPVGMSGNHLQANVHLITAAEHLVDNIAKCVRRCGLEVGTMVLQPLASALAVLTEDELKLGVCMADIGAGTTDIVVYQNGAIVYTAVLPVAGDLITKDVAVTFRTPTAAAEDIKLRYGCAMREAVRDDETIEVQGTGDHGPTSRKRSALVEIIQPRYVELIELINQELNKPGLRDRIVAGFVFTGGSSKMEGLRGLAEQTLHAPVRIGHPANHVVDKTGRADNLIYATGIGLVLYALSIRKKEKGMHEKKGKADIKKIWHNVRNWIERNF